MADSSEAASKPARNIRVGDRVSTREGCSSAAVIAVLHMEPSERELVKVGDLLITNRHPVLQDGRWVKPITLPGAVWVRSAQDLYNFVIEDQLPFEVEGVTAASVGTACHGLFNPSNKRHCVWNSERVVNILMHHNSWPNIEVGVDDPLFAALCDENLIEEYLNLEEDSGDRECYVTPSLLRLAQEAW